MKQKRPVKVLHIVGAMNRAGTETMLMNLYREIDRSAVQFDFISYSEKNAHYDQEIRSLGGAVYNLEKTTSVKEIYQIIKMHGPYDAVHSHTLFHSGIANLAAFFAGVKLRIAHAHTTFDHSETFVRKVYIVIMRWLILIFSTDLLACSEAAGRYLFGKKSTINKKYAYFPNVIDYAKFLQRPITDIKKFKVSAGLGSHMVIGHIGRFSKEKNQLFLIDIMKCLVEKDPSIKLLLVGEGELRTFAEKKVKNEGLNKNIRFLGIREDVNILLHSMDVFIFPSTYEGLGLVLLEAQACGLPCVVSEAIQPEADTQLGLITKLSLNDNPELWAEKIMNLKDKKVTNEKRIRDAFESSGYSLTEGIKKIMQIYQPGKGEAYERNSDRFI